MNRVKSSTQTKTGSNHSRIIIECNRGRNHMANQLALRSNQRKSNINWPFRRAKWFDAILKLINSFVNGANNDLLMKPITQK